MNMRISKANMASLVKKNFQECFFQEGDDFSNCIRVFSATCGRVGISAKRLQQKKNVVTAIIANLPLEPKKELPFLQLCKTKNGDVWAMDPMICEQLTIMAVGLNLLVLSPQGIVSLAPTCNMK